MPMYEYEVIDRRGNPTGERFEAFQRMSDEPLTSTEDGRPCRKAVILPAMMRAERKPKKRERRERAIDRLRNSGKGVYNPKLSNPHVSNSLPYDPRDGEIVMEHGQKVRKHADGTMSTYDPNRSANDRRPIIRDEDDRQRYCAYFNATHIKE